MGEIDGEFRGLLGPRQTGSGVGEPGIAPTIDGVAARLETAAVSRIQIVSFGCSVQEFRMVGRRSC